MFVKNHNRHNHQRKWKKEEFGMELFSKEYIKIKDPNELISKDNLTDSDK